MLLTIYYGRKEGTMAEIDVDVSQEGLERIMAKLATPPKAIHRPRLVRQMQEGMRRKLTIIVAPAGSGKTTLIYDWLSSLEKMAVQQPVVWVRLDRHDNGTSLLWGLIDAIREIGIEVTFGYASTARSLYSATDYSLLKATLKCIDSVDISFSVVFDDFHLLQDEVAHSTFRYLFEHAPQNMHVIIASRTMPSIPLSRLRSQQQVIEIFANDISFAEDEAREYFDTVMEMPIASSTVSNLWRTTEGWIAGLQIAALSLKGGREEQTFLKEFSGGHYQIFDYLTEEVIDQQPAKIREFMIKTSILSRMNPDLCNAVLGVRDSRETIKHLEQANLFLTSLDDVRYWFRYHSLFSGYLRMNLKIEYADEIPHLHRTACIWLVENDYLYEAIPHAFACGDYEMAADALVSAYINRSIFRYNVTSFIQWAESLSFEVVAKRPHLVLIIALARTVVADRKKLEDFVNEYREVLNREFDEGYATPANPGLYEEMLMMRTIIACALGDYMSAIQYYDRIGTKVRTENKYLVGMLSHFMNYAYYAYGMFEKAEAVLKAGLRVAVAEGLEHERLSSMCVLAQLYKDQGRLGDATDVLLKALEYAETHAVDSKIEQLVRISLGDVSLECLRMDEADRYLGDIATKLAGGADGLFRMSFPDWSFVPTALMTIARYFMIHEKYDAAEDCITRAEDLRQQCYMIPFLYARTAAMRAHIWTASGDVAKLGVWADDMQSRVDSGERISVIERTALASACLALGKARHALVFLEPLQEEGFKSPMLLYRIQMYLTKALALAQVWDRVAAKIALRTAIDLSAPEGYLEVYLGRGSSISSLLAEVLRDAGVQERMRDDSSFASYLKKLDKHCKELQSLDAARGSIREPGLTEALSSRELEILNLMVDGKGAQEISQSLFISINTVRTHIKSIYRKLTVHNRDEAIESAVKTGLI